ncbi:MAG: inorganic diphosphatase [Acidobacteriaceae bacterium]
MNPEFWEYLQELVDSSLIVIDRPKGSEHPRFASKSYPVDYGYLENTTSMDKGGVDVWVGSQKSHQVIGVLCTVDLMKRDTELKILIDCSEKELQAIEKFSQHEQMRVIAIKKNNAETRK